MSRRRLLLVEDRDALRRMLAEALGERFEVVGVPDAEAAVAALDGGGFAIVLTDLQLPGADGLEVVSAARRRCPAAAVVVMTAFGTIATAVEAMRRGAADFLEKPIDVDELGRRLADLQGDREQPALALGPEGPTIVGSHPRLRAALRLLRRAAPTEATVLLTGESGTGKELFARALHELSPRAGRPFVAVNCAAIPESLVENELFGHERGAFTGAHRRQPGRFERAAGGTLFLDEIGELPLPIQGKVLRVLEERVYEPVGGGRPCEADVRIVAATNRELGEMVAAGSFRGDLYYRLEVFPIHLPSLADRREDLPALAAHLLAASAARHELTAPRLDRTALAALAERDWPGNVRQLGNLLERAVILHPGEALGAAQLAPLLAAQGNQGESERDRLRAALREADGDKERAAELLGVSYRTLQRRVKEHDLEGFPRWRD